MKLQAPQPFETYMQAIKPTETKCDKCGKMWYIQESYGANDTDEYYETEVGHDFNCVYRNIDHNNRPYVKEVK
jgi:hypothetical protein